MKRVSAKVLRRSPRQGALIFVLFWTAMLSVAAQSDATNFITIREKSGVTTNQYPVQIGRPFAPGEIPNFPQAVIGSTNLVTQADVKTRWPDGSVKHAVLSFYLPTLPANGTVTVNFINQTSDNTTGFLAKADMLASGFNFDAAMELTNGGTTLSASARAMLSADKFEYWHKGAVMTSVIIADHSAARASDIGFDANKSFRPIFHATFWPGINKVKVRYIGEIANTEALQDQTYALALKLGSTSPLTVYNKSAFKHIAASRWTKEFWLGGVPSTIEINHNLAYLTKSKALPNYDTSRVIPESALSQAYLDPYSGWSLVAKDLYDPGNMLKYMGSTGGRDEIGPYPTWTVRWLYTGDQRVQEQSFGNANLSAAFPVHFREGNGAKTFESGGTNALGRVLSIHARPTVFLNSGNFFINFQYTDPADKIVPVGAMTDDGWYPDGAHQPDFHSPLYLLTGDYFYLEEMYFWASWGAAYTSPGTDVSYGRGPTSATGGITGEVRSDAWIFRNRVQAASFAPDGTPEKTYFTKLTNDAIAIWEGTVGIMGTSNQGNANWNWGNTVAVQKYGPHGVPTIPALRFWEEGGSVPSWSEEVDPAIATNRTAPWQHAFLIYSLGQAKNLGFAAEPLLTWLSPMMVGQITNSGYNPYLLGAYQMPTVRKTDNRFFDLWSQSKTGFLTNYNALQIFTDQLSDANHGYPMIAIPATGMVAHHPGGSAAWSFIQQQVLTASSLNSNPKWVILPTSNAPPPCSFNLAATSEYEAATPGTGSLSFTAPSSTCVWTATQNQDWLIITSGTAGVGNGTITYSVAANPGQERTGTLTIAGQTYTVTQAASCTNVTVTTSPASQTVTAGQTITFTAAAGGNPSPTVQWQVKIPGGSFTDLSGATSATLSFTGTSAHNGNQYRAVFSNDCSTATTNVATLTVTGSAATLVLSEFRTRGSGGATLANASLDEYVEVANRTDSSIIISSSDSSAGWSVVALDSSNSPFVLFTIPNGTVLPRTGHYLGVNSVGYSLSSYGGTNAASGNATWTTDLPDGTGLALFTTSNPLNFNIGTRLDSVGFSGGTNPLFREGTGLTPASGIADVGEYAFVRKQVHQTGLPVDSEQNESDFFFVGVNPVSYSGRLAIFGSPGPENLASPLNYHPLSGRAEYIETALLDVSKATSAQPNQVPSTLAADKDVTHGSLGSIYLQRSYTNRTGKTLTKLRLRIVDLTTDNRGTLVTPQGMHRIITSVDTTATVGGNTLTVKGTTLEAVSGAHTAGGINATLEVPLPVGGLPPNATVHLRLRLGVKVKGQFYIQWTIEAITQ